jgi:hypothetical protein
MSGAEVAANTDELEDDDDDLVVRDDEYTGGDDKEERKGRCWGAVELAGAAAGAGGGAKRWMRLSINETELEFFD